MVVWFPNSGGSGPSHHVLRAALIFQIDASAKLLLSILELFFLIIHISFGVRLESPFCQFQAIHIKLFISSFN
jgi:hypothetical protein